MSKKELKNQYSKLVGKFNSLKTFIGKSPKCKNADGYGKYFDGNSILLNIAKNKYIWICEQIIKFTTKEPIVEFYSLIGHNDVPYPVAFSKNYAYFMLDMKCAPISSFGVKLNKCDKADAYRYFYGHDGYSKLSNVKGLKSKILYK